MPVARHDIFEKIPEKVEKRRFKRSLGEVSKEYMAYAK
jgi:hypothetical protein